MDSLRQRKPLSVKRIIHCSKFLEFSPLAGRHGTDNTKIKHRTLYKRAKSSARWRAARRPDRAQLRRLLDTLDAGDVLMVTRLDRLARSTRDLLNTLASIAGKQAGFRSLGDTWADTTTPHGRLMLTVLGGLAEFERELSRVRTTEGRARFGERR